MNDVLSYLTLAYVVQTVSKLIASLIPLKSPQHLLLLREWSAAIVGVALSFGTQINLLEDFGIGLDLSLNPLGYIITGLILGHGVQYGANFLSQGPWKDLSNQKQNRS